ncbi:hypothetical protein JL721_419 [Aureococcus anophagefferens]|nr:hypothetical protein JL721_419 [Aureococcus anophagefferens]
MLDSTADARGGRARDRWRTEWKDDASAEDEGRSRKHLSARGAATPPDGFGGTSMLLIQFVVLPRKMGTGRDSLEVRDPRPGPARAARRGSGGSDEPARPAQSDENVVTCFIDAAATLKRARKQGLLRPVAPRPLNARVARRRRRFRTTSIAVARAGPPVTGRSSFRDPSGSIPDDLDPVARRLQFDFVLMLCRRLGVKDVFLFATEAGAPAWLTLGFEHVGSSASLIHLRFDLLFKRDRGVLARSARGPETPRLAAARWTARSRSSATPRASTPWSAVQERVAEYGEKQVVRLAKEAANAAAEAEAENDDDVPAAPRTCRSTTCSRRRRRRAPVAPAPPAAPSPSALADASPPPPREAPRRRRPRPRSPRGRAAGAGAAPLRRRVQKRVVDDADADDEDEAWEPGRPSMMDLDDDEQEQAAKAKRKLKRRSKKKSAQERRRRRAPRAGLRAPARAAAPRALDDDRAAATRRSRPGRGGRAAPRPLPKIREQERNAFLERIQAEEVRREQARIAAARPVPPPPNRATGADDDSDGGFEESDNDDPVEDLIHRERIRERDLLRTPGCLALGRKAFRLEDMPRHGARPRDPAAPSTSSARPSGFAPASAAHASRRRRK